MADIIHLLPDSVANQIAAGEVIQRPASVVKELVENALDAGATEIIVNIKDAGKTLIQVTDNGCGMSPSDARMAFERHATSKIRSANDLFAIRTMGFRGEALASIAAIADVEIRTKRPDDETGTILHISATQVVRQEPLGCNRGSSIQVKNLFFNVPARRKFLKTPVAEMKHIINELQRVAIPQPGIAFSLYHNNNLVFELPATTLRKRISGLFGKNIHQSLIPVETTTTVVKLSGYIGLPQYARKTAGEQFFFVNGRFMRHPYFHKAITQAYEKLLSDDAFPAYFLFLEVDPAAIDINVHPTKTEIKFEDEKAIWQIINCAAREALGKFNVVPAIDFDQDGSFEIPLPPKAGFGVPFPVIETDPDYNPFRSPQGGGNTPQPTQEITANRRHWEKLYEGLGQHQNSQDYPDPELNFFKKPTGAPLLYQGRKALQMKQKYIVSPVKSGLMVIDQKRAKERILYERFMEILKTEKVASQQILFPHTFELNSSDATLLKEILPDLSSLGFDVREFGKDTFIINGVPGVLSTNSPVQVLEKLLEEYKTSPVDAGEKVREQVATLLAKASAINYGGDLQPEEIDHLIDELFACGAPNYTPDGKPVLAIVPLEDIEKLFKI